MRNSRKFRRRRKEERFQEHFKLEPEILIVTSVEKRFLQNAIGIIEKNISNTDFTATLLGKEMGMHRVHLNRKIKALTGYTTTLFIRTIRLKRAAQLLREKSGNITEISYDVGFNNPSYFANCFRKQYSVSPTTFVRIVCRKTGESSFVY